jgi:Tfp pilus assembly protein PilV
MVLNKKYSASTLPEVLIAIVILSFTSALGTSIYLNIQKSTQPFQKLKAADIATYYMKESEQKHDYFDKSFNEDGFTIKKTVSHSDIYPDCLILKVSVSTKEEKKICEIQKMVHAD